MRDIKNKLTSSKNTKNIQTRKGKSFGYQVLGFGAGGSAATFLTATGGTISTDGNFKIHTFTGNGTFTVETISTADAADNTVSYIVVAGGGGAGGDEGGGGGGAGGFREVKSPSAPYTASPLDGYPSAPNRVTVTEQAYPITVGGGGNGGAGPPKSRGTSGGSSVFSSITSTGGGGGGYGNGPTPDLLLYGFPGGSGGASGGRVGGPFQAASKGQGNTPPVSPSQGNPGGAAKTCTSNSADAGGGGGGAGATGSNGGNPTGPGGAGGNGVVTNINPAVGSPTTNFSGGGGGGGNVPTGAPGGAGGSGGGGAGRGSSGAANAGVTNSGGGGGGAGGCYGGGNGGSGIVVIRYKFQ